MIISRRPHAIRVPLLLLGGVLSVTSGGRVHAADDAQPWFLSGARIYVAPDAAPVDNGVVVVRDGKIVSVGRKGSIALPAGARESQCTGGIVTAGFQNSHVHFTAEQFSDARNASAESLTRALTQMLTRYGFTTVVDTGSDRNNTLPLRSRIESGEVRGPRILTVGIPLYPPNGIPFYLADLPKSLRDRMPQPSTPEEAVRIVRENLDAGADGTKLFVATPQGNDVVKRMPAEVARAAVNETHRRGKLAMAHPTDIEGMRAALAANVDILVHTTLGEETAWPDSLVQQIIEQHASVVPTLKLWHYELDKGKVPAAVQQRLIGATLHQLKGFAAAGGQVLFGTDVGYMTDFDVTEEYELMSKAGLSAMQILASLTTAPAARWKESDRRGRVAAGMDADIVVLDADPAADARNFAKVRCAFRQGTAIYASSAR